MKVYPLIERKLCEHLVHVPVVKLEIKLGDKARCQSDQYCNGGRGKRTQIVGTFPLEVPEDQECGRLNPAP